jgi:hypothetical protein
MLKVGLRLKCKKDYESRIIGNTIFKKDEYYPITDIDENYCRLEVAKENGDYKTVMQYDEFEKYDYSNLNYHNLWDWFYTVEELRKMKIEEILK